MNIIKPFAIFAGITLLFFILKHVFNPYDFEVGSWMKFVGEASRNGFYSGAAVCLAILLRKVKFLGTSLAVFAITFILLVGFDSYYMVGNYYYYWFPEKYVAPPSEHPELSFSVVKEPYDITEMNELFGFYNRESDTIESIITENGVELPPVYYITDKYNRRINRDDSSTVFDRYAIFIGCSVTFGLHVAEDQSLPAYFGRMNPNYHVYNYGVNGSGPNHYLAMLQELDIRSQIEENKGVVIYPYFDDHTKRAISDFVHYQWNDITPYFYLSENDELVRNSDFRHGRPWMALIYKILSKSYFIKSINFNYPKELKSEDFELTMAIIQEMKKIFVTQFGAEEFYVLILPGFDTEIVPYLEKYDIKYIDGRSAIPEYWNGQYTFSIDNHPKGKAYEILADTLTSQIIKKQRH